MCGIGGELTTTGTNEDELTDVVGQIIDRFAHRGPDGREIWVDARCGIGLGHRRLAVIDLSPTGAQPIVSRSGRWVLTYNGEIYNHRELRTELEGLGVRWRGTCDAEVLVEAFDAWGVQQTLRKANGMFGFGVWDRDEQCLTIARDRMGEKPVYYAASAHHFAFASEVKGLLTRSWVDRSINPNSIASVLQWGFVARPDTIYNGTAQLEPGHLMEVRGCAGSLTTTTVCWWSLSEAVATNAATQRPTTVGQAAQELEPLLAKAVTQRLDSDVPLGAFLSGGIDSALIAALAQRAMGSDQLNTFTVKMPDLGVDESEAAATVASRLGTQHTVVELQRQEAFDLIPQLSEVWDEPFGDPSMIPSMLLCQAARKQLTVCLGGDGGDELFGGYNRHAMAESVLKRAQRIPPAVRRGLGRAVRAVPQQHIDRAATGVNRAVPKRWHVASPGVKMHKLGALVAAEPSQTWSSLAQVWPNVSTALAPQPVAPPPGLTVVEQLMWADTSMVLPDNMLVKMDRASMACALEVRTPFLDPELFAWAWRQPSSVKTGGGVGKLVLRQLVSNLGLGDVAARPKIGFDPPLANWLRGPLREWASDLLASPRAVVDGYLEASAVNRVWVDHVHGRRNNEYQLWALLMLESWLRTTL
jgi:asparagine synthase (glutamine-hydrolysing)